MRSIVSLPAASTRGTHDGTPRASHLALERLLPRDRALVLAVACMRVCTYDQLGRLVFPTRHASIVRRRARALARMGWLATARPAVATGGAPAYVLPTSAGLAAALRALAVSAAGTPYEQLVERMVPVRPRAPLRIGRIPPPFLAHQREVNELLVAYGTCPGFTVRWASSWERPFGRGADVAALPQPDYVLVLARDGGAVLVFGEHDRGQESLAHFQRTKAERYAAFALPAFAVQTFGVAAVEVWLTVTDPIAQRPRRRIAQLAAVLAAAGAAPIARIALAGRAYASPAARSTWLAARDAGRW